MQSLSTKLNPNKKQQSIADNQRTCKSGLQLEDVRADGVEEDLVVTDHQQDAREALREPLLQPHQCVQIQVVRGLILVVKSTRC